MAPDPKIGPALPSACLHSAAISITEPMEWRGSKFMLWSQAASPPSPHLLPVSALPFTSRVTLSKLMICV